MEAKSPWSDLHNYFFSQFYKQIHNIWEAFVKALQIHFSTIAYDDPIEELRRLWQTLTVPHYKAQFEALSNGINGYLEDHKLSCVLSGLCNEISSN